MKRTFAACLALLMALSLRADTVVFKTGEELEGIVLEKDEINIKLEVEQGTVMVPMIRVRRIDPDTPEKIAERERLKAEAKELAEKMAADGKVLYKGKWVTEEAKKAAEAKIAEARKKKKEEAEAAKKKAEEAAAKAKEEAAKQAALAAQQDLNNQNNNSRNDRFSRRHSRDDLTNQGMNGSYNNGSGYNNGGYNNYNQNSGVVNNYRGR